MDKQGKPALDCMCGNILQERYDPSLSFFTTQGSFWSNNTTLLLASTTPKERQTRTRNRCNGSGYESVTLVPLRFGGVTYGLMQFNDKRVDYFSADMISFLETVAAAVALALSRLDANKALTTSEAKYRALFDCAADAIFIVDENMRFTSVNESACTRLGYSEAELLSMGPADIDAPDFTERNFALSEYADTSGRKLPCYDLTRDGFSLLVMGFTGEKALQWKIRYIQAFNAMEQALQSGRPTSRQIAPGLCSPEEIRALKGAARLLAYFELKDFQDIVWGLCEFCGLSSLDNLPSGDFEDAFQYLVRRLQTFKTASGDQIKATDKQIAVIEGLKDYAAFMYENDSWKGKVHDNMGRLIDVENLSKGQANKLISMFALDLSIGISPLRG